jgi:nitronate monooxygenase
MRQQGSSTGDLDRIQAWAGQSCAYARPVPAGQIVEQLWQEAQRLLPEL